MIFSAHFNLDRQATNKISRESQPLVTVHVKPPADHTGEKRSYVMHTNIICYYSPFFDAAFNSGFKEGETQELELEDTCPESFGIFVNWLYKQRIEWPLGWVFDVRATLLNLWLLADRLVVPKLQNQALTFLENARGLKHTKHQGRALPVHMFYPVYDNTLKDSPLRKYIAATWNNGVIDPDDEDIPSELQVDILNTILSRGTLAKPAALSMEELKEFFVSEEVKRPENPDRQAAANNVGAVSSNPDIKEVGGEMPISEVDEDRG